MKLSIVTSLYQSKPYLDEFHRRASAAARSFAGDDYELILVNDGSPDASLAEALKISQTDGKVVVIDLSRNFGQHKAILTGLKHSRGDFVFLLDSDLEEEPEWLASFYEEIDLHSCDVAYGVQATRRGSWFERWSGQLFYKMFNWLTGLEMPGNITTARLFTRRYVNALLQHQESEIFMAGLWHITGFDQAPVPVTKHASSETTYTLRRKISMFVTSVTSFSSVPLIAIFYIGIFILFLAMLGLAFLLINRFFLIQPLSGWTSVMASVWLLGGLIISFLGVIGIYLHKIFVEIKRRPLTIVKEVYTREDPLDD